MKTNLFYKILMLTLFFSFYTFPAKALQDSFYCNGDLILLQGDSTGPEVINKDGESFELDSLRNEIVRASFDGKTSFLKIQAFAKVKWNKEGEDFPSRFKFTTDKKTWFAIEAAMDADDTVRHLFCQRDQD